MNSQPYVTIAFWVRSVGTALGKRRTQHALMDAGRRWSHTDTRRSILDATDCYPWSPPPPGPFIPTGAPKAFLFAFILALSLDAAFCLALEYEAPIKGSTARNRAMTCRACSSLSLVSVATIFVSVLCLCGDRITPVLFRERRSTHLTWLLSFFSKQSFKCRVDGHLVCQLLVHFAFCIL